MKEDQQDFQDKNKRSLPPRSITFFIRFINNPAVYISFIILFFALGYLLAPIYRTSPPQHTGAGEAALDVESTTSRKELSRELDNFLTSTRCGEPIPPGLVRQTIIDRVFDSTSPYDNYPPAVTQDRRKRIRGWGSQRRVFQHLIEKVKPKVIIEVGSFLGASTLHMAKLTRQLDLDTQILCIDDFRGWPEFNDQFPFIDMMNGEFSLMQEFMHNIIYSNATESVMPIPFTTSASLSSLCRWGVYGDLIEIDAGHDFISVWADINRAYRILRPGGVMFGHDYLTRRDNRGVRRAVHLFARVNGLNVQIDDQHWVIDTSS